MRKVRQISTKILVSIFLFHSLFANYDPSEGKFIVKKIVFLGNKKTKAEIIARELTFTIGSAIDSVEIKHNENRIYGTGLFNEVRIWIDQGTLENDSVSVYIQVSERWYIWPFPIFGWKDRDIKNLYYGAGLIHTNFRGRAEKLSFAFVLGYDPWIGVGYSNPLLSMKNNLFLVSNLYHQKAKNRSKVIESIAGEFYQNIFALNLSIGKRIGLYRRVWINNGFKSIVITDTLSRLKTISKTGQDKIISIGAGFKYDTRDIPAYPTQGVLLGFTFSFNKFLNSASFFVQTNADFHSYKKVGVGLIFTRLFLMNSIGKEIPFYSRFYFGYSERLRGYFYEIFEGENIFGGTIEYRVPIIRQRFLKFAGIPFEEFSVLRLGLDFVIFFDIGRTWYNSERFFKLSYWKGYGLGLNFLLPYDLIFSFEVAQNHKGKRQFIFDFKGEF